MIFRRLAKDSAIYGGADLLTKAIAFFIFPLIAAALTPQAFGVLELMSTSTALLGMVANCGLNNAVQRFYWDKDLLSNDQIAIVTSGFFAQMFFSLLAVAGGLLALPWVSATIEKQALPLSWIALVAALLVMVFTQWTQYALDVIRLHFAPWRFLSVSLASRVLSIAAGFWVVVTMGMGIDGLFSAQAMVLLLVVPFALYSIRKDFSPGRLSRAWVVKLSRFGYPFIFAGLAFWLFGSMDRWMLASMSSIDEAGIYAVGYKFATLPLFVSGAFAQAWSPFANKLRNDHPDRYRQVFADVFLVFLCIMLTVGGGLSLFSGEIIGLLLPSAYANAAVPLIFLAFGVVVQATTQISVLGISIAKKTHLLSHVAWGTALVNFMLNYLLIPQWGAAGSALATLFSYLFLTAAYFCITQRLHPFPFSWFKLGLLATLGGSVVFVSLHFQSFVFEWRLVAMKFVFGCGCLIIAGLILPWRRMRGEIV